MQSPKLRIGRHLALSAQCVIHSFPFESSEKTMRVNQRRANKVSSSLKLTAVELETARGCQKPCSIFFSPPLWPSRCFRKEMSQQFHVRLVQGAQPSSILVIAVKASQQLLDGIHSKSLSFDCCRLHGGSHSLHLTTRVLNECQELITFLEKFPMKLNIQHFSFFSLCAL